MISIFNFQNWDEKIANFLISIFRLEQGIFISGSWFLVPVSRTGRQWKPIAVNVKLLLVIIEHSVLMVTVFYYKSMLEKVSMHAKNPAIFSFKALASGICSFKAFSDFHVPRKYGRGANFGIEKLKLKIGIRISIFIFLWKLKIDVQF